MEKYENFSDYIKAVKKDKEEHPERYSMELVSAVKDGDLDLVSSLLRNGTDVDQEDPYGVTSLMIACHKGHYEMVRLLLENGANPNSIDCADTEFDFTGMTPALWASDMAIIYLLVNHGADINIQSKVGGQSVLHKAIEAQDPRIVELCISKGANINVATHNGETPLMTAIKAGNASIIGILIEHGADVNQQDNIGVSPLNLARSFRQKLIESLLIRSGATVGQDIEEKLVYWHFNDDNSTSVLFAYTDFDTKDGVTHVLACGIDQGLSDKPCFGLTTFHFRIKDSKVLDYCVGIQFRWDAYVLKEGEKTIGIYKSWFSSKDIKNNFPIMCNEMKIQDDWEFEGWDFIPAQIDQNELYIRQNKLSNFFSKYYSLTNDIIEIYGLPISFPIFNVNFEKPLYEFTDFYTSCYSCNVDHDFLDLFSDIIFQYLGR